MNKMHKQISKFTGNLCFAASKDDGDYVLYVSRKDRSISYSTLSSLVEGICYQKMHFGLEYFLVSHGNNWITQFDGSNVNETYIDASPYSICEMVNGEQNEYFALDRDNGMLIKFGITWAFPSFTFIWGVELDGFDFSNTGLIYRGSSKTIVVNDNNKLLVIRDDLGSGVVINSLAMPGDGVARVISGGNFNPEFTHIRYRQVYGDDLDVSSSSSLSSISSETSGSTSSSSSST